jgi:hypothetical protein
LIAVVRIDVNTKGRNNMAGIQLTRMAANAAYEEMQKAYELLFCSDDVTGKTEKDLLKSRAEQHMRKVNEWLLSLKNE